MQSGRAAVCIWIFWGTLEFAGLPSNFTTVSVQTFESTALVMVQGNSHWLPNHCKPVQMKTATRIISHTYENLIVSFKLFFLCECELKGSLGRSGVEDGLFQGLGGETWPLSALSVTSQYLVCCRPAQRGHAPSGPVSAEDISRVWLAPAPRPRVLSTNTALSLSLSVCLFLTRMFIPRRPAGSDLLLYHSSHLFLPRPSLAVTSLPLFSPLSSLVPSGFLDSCSRRSAVAGAHAAGVMVHCLYSFRYIWFSIFVVWMELRGLWLPVAFIVYNGSCGIVIFFYFLLLPYYCWLVCDGSPEFEIHSWLCQWRLRRHFFSFSFKSNHSDVSWKDSSCC